MEHLILLALKQHPSIKDDAKYETDKIQETKQNIATINFLSQSQNQSIKVIN